MKLLVRSTRSHLLFATIILLIAIPVFYIAIQRIVLEDVDESLMAQKQYLINNITRDSAALQLPVHSFVDIIPYTGNNPLKADSLYTQIIYDSLSNENIPYRVVESHLSIHGNPFVLIFKHSLIDGEDLIQSIILLVIGILIIIIGGMILINRISSRKLWSPFYKTLNQLRNFEIEKKDPVSLPKTSIDEFNDLHQSINTLTAKSQETFQSQKAFTENASHEMQTPLAILQGKLELLMQTSPLTAEQASLISDLADANQRMNHLNKNLLLLTRIENNQFYEKQPLIINTTIHRIVEQYQSQADRKSLAFHVDIGKNIELTANPTLIDILFTNLISNSIRHNKQNGMVEILCEKDGCVLIRNTGRATALDQTTLFSRFQKESTDKDSLGLGLAISHKICELNNYRLNYTFENGLHTFRLQFFL